MSRHKRTRRWDLGLILILGVTTLIYAPSLWHVARSDHIVYLAQCADNHDLVSLTAGAHDLNRKMSIPVYRDEKLFRPLVYVVLGSEKFLFGYRFWLWQAFGILCHLAVVVLLYQILRELSDKTPALTGTFFFATLFSGMEMVIWHHINSYLVFICCLLLIVLKLLRRKTLTPTRGTLLALFVACLSYETGIFFAGILFVAAFLTSGTNDKKRSFLWLGPPAIYSLWNFLNLTANRISVSSFFAKETDAGLLQTLKNFLLSFVWWIYSGLFPSELRLTICQRTALFPAYMFKPETLLSFHSLRDGISNISGLAVLVLFTALLALSLWAPRRDNRSLLTVIGSFLLCFSAVLVLGRINRRSLEYILTNNSYNTYFFWVFFMIVLWGTIHFKSLSARKGTKTLVNAALLTLFATSVLNASFTLSLNVQKAFGDRPRLALTRTVNKLISQKGKEPGFSFGFNKKDRWLNPPYPFKSPYLPNEGKKTYCELLYPKHYDPIRPQYVLEWKDEKVVVKKR